jgi:cytochrome c
MHLLRRTGLALCLLSFLLPTRGAAAEGDAGEGKRLILGYGCGSCHGIPGIPGARGIVGPPLDHMGRRGYIAGVLANTPEAMTRWLRDPPAVDASTAMPAQGLSEAEARDIAAYLFTLK